MAVIEYIDFRFQSSFRMFDGSSRKISAQKQLFHILLRVESLNF